MDAGLELLRRTGTSLMKGADSGPDSSWGMRTNECRWLGCRTPSVAPSYHRFLPLMVWALVPA